MTEPVLAATPETNGLDVGERLRAIRLLRRLTLREVADVASVATLQRLAAAVGIEISDLFADELQSGPRVLRRQERQLLEWGHLGRKALLTPKPFHSLEVVAAAFDVGGSTGDEPYTHGDSEELLLVLAGRVHLQLGSELLDLSKGDSVNYRSSTPHRVSNRGDEPAEVLFVISPPSY